MAMNISSVQRVSLLMQSIDQPARLQILLAIGEGETCVCHLEATFGWRQAYLSQHLMALREVNARWQAEMGPFFEQLGDQRPDEGMAPLQEIFHLD